MSLSLTPNQTQFHRIQAFKHLDEKDQLFFQKNSSTGIDFCVDKIFKKYLEERTSDPEKSTSCFDKTIKTMSSHRNAIARKTEQRSALNSGVSYDETTCKFGISRTKQMPTVYELVLGGGYEQTGNKVAQLIARDLLTCREFEKFRETSSAEIVPTAGETSTPGMNFTDEKGLNLQMNWKFLHAKDIDPTSIDPTDVSSDSILKSKAFGSKVQEMKKLRGSLTFSDIESLTTSFSLEMVHERKRMNPEMFWCQRDMSIITHMQKDLPRFESLRPSQISSRLRPAGYIIGTLSYSLQGRDPVVLTKYSTYFESIPGEPKEEILERIQRCSFIKLSHQDITDVPITLSDAKLYFDDAIHWTPEQGIEQLKNSVGKMIYLLAHNHRDVRGTAAATEWIEKAIYKLHGFQLASPEERMPDLIAFGNYHMDEYLEEYKGSFNLDGI